MQAYLLNIFLLLGVLLLAYFVYYVNEIENEGNKLANKIDKEKFLKPFNGSIKEAAKQLKVSYSFVQQVLIGAKPWPIKRIDQAHAFGIPKYVLRPDLFPTPPKNKK